MGCRHADRQREVIAHLDRDDQCRPQGDREAASASCGNGGNSGPADANPHLRLRDRLVAQMAETRTAHPAGDLATGRAVA